MAAPAHYIRSIHTSFTAAHPHSSSAWANAASSTVARSQYHTQHQHQHPRQERDRDTHHHPQQYPGYGPSINSHNHHTYTHHLQALSMQHHHQQYAHPQAYPQLRKSTPGLTGTASSLGPAPSASGAGGRRRSVSIRMPPSYVPPSAHAQVQQRPPPVRAAAPPPAAAYKFDPFADEDLSGSSAPSSSPQLSVTSPLTTSFHANTLSTESGADLVHPPPQAHSAPYTIHIPAAAPNDIQRYTPPPASPRPAPARLRSLTPIAGPAPGANPNLSKIVAGILLNRVHAVGKPMRRRVLPRLTEGAPGVGYRKSCLSSVVSVEA